MAELSDQTLRNINQRLNDIKSTIDLTQMSVHQLGQALKEDLSPEQVTSFVNALSKVSNRKANKIRLIMELVDEKGKPITESVIKDRIKEIENAFETVGKGRSRTIGGVVYRDVNSLTVALSRYREMLNVVKMDSASAFDIIQKTINATSGGNKKQQSEISKQRVKDEKEVQKIQEKTTASLQKRTELEEKLKTLKPNGKAWRDVKAELERVNKEVQNYLAAMGSLGTAGARQLKAYEKAGLITNADKAQLAIERQQIDLLRQRMQAEQQWNRLVLQRNNAALAGKSVSPKVTDSIERLQERMDAIDKQRVSSYQNFTQTSLQRIEGMWQNHETALTNIKTQGEQARQRIEERRYNAVNRGLEESANRRQQLQQQIAKDIEKEYESQERASKEISDQKARDALREQKQEEENEKRMREAKVAESKSAYEEQARLQKENTESRIADEKRASELIQKEQKRRASQERASKKAEKVNAGIDKEAVANMRRQIQIKQRLSELDHTRSINSGKRTKEEKAEYAALNRELTNLIKRQKELNSLNSGATRRARGTTASYAASAQTREAERYRAALERIGRQQQRNKQGLESMLPILRRLASAFGVAFSVQGLVQFGKKLIETRGEFELQQVALRSILQNKQVADEIWDKTMQAALQSPFRAMQLVRYTKQLAAYRIETDKLFDTTKRLADVSAGLGVDMGRLILAYGQVKAANYLRASEIRQFTEAGVNILGELSTYFSETRNEMVSTAQVMDMVQKRMVKFEDVEAIFKRMTDQGGIFYNMQYVQSQTVKGQINKLHDAYDQMLNSIGKSNEGTIKDFVAALNNIVKNWKTWAVVIKSIGSAAAIGFITKYTMAITGLGKASMSTMRTMVKLRTTVRSLSISWPMLATAGIAAVISTLFSLSKRMEEANKQIDEQNLRLFETRNNFADLKARIEENNRVIKENKSTTETLNKAQSDNKSIMAKLKNEYPDLAERMGVATNGIIEMNNALDINIRKLNEQMTLISQQKQSDWFSDTDKENLEQYEADLSTITTSLITAQSKAREQMMNLELDGDTTSEQYETLKKITELDLSGNILDARDAFLELAKVLGAYNDNWFVQWAERTQIYGKTSRTKMASRFGISADDLKYPFDEENVKKILDKESAALKEYYFNGIKDNEEYLKEINEKYDGNIIKWISRNADKINQGTLDGINKANETLIKVLNPQTPAFKAFINRYYNQMWGLIDTAYINELNKQLGAKRAELMRSWSIGLQGEVEELERRINAIVNGVDLTSTANPSDSSTETETPEEKKSKIDAAWRRRIALLEEMKRRYDELAKSAYGYAKSNTTVRKEFETSWGKIFGSVLSMNAVQFTSAAEMEAAFNTILAKAGAASDAVKEEIQKKADSYGARIPIDVQVRIREDFGRQIEEAFGNYELTLDLQKLNLSSDVLSDLFNLETVGLSDLRRRIVEFYNERVAEGADPTELVKQVEGYYKKIDDMERKQQRELIKEYAKYLEYELSERAKIEMEYTRKSADVAANPAFTQAQKKQIQKRLEEERNKAVAKQEWEDFKSSETYIQMMEDLEHQGTNALMAMRVELERMRENAENLSPRALKEVVNALEKIDEIALKRGLPISNIINSAYAVRGARVGAIESGLLFDQVSSRKTAKQTQADIKAQLLPMEQQYNILQSQLGAEKEIARLEQERYENGRKLEEIFGEAFLTGDNEYLQELINSRLADMESSQNKIAELTEQRKSANEGDLKVIDKQLAEEQSKIESLMAENELLQKQLEYNLAIAKAALNRAATSEERASLQARIDAMEEELEKLRGQDAAVGELTKKYGLLDKAIVNAIENFKNMLSTFDSFKTMMDSFGVDTSTGGWAMFDAAKQTVGAMADVAGKIASQDYIGAAIAVVTGIFESIATWNKASDQYLQDTIEEEQRRIEALQDAYARLERQIEKTWSTIDYMNTYEQQVANIRAQIRAMEAQMAAERDKKDTDDNAVRQYQRDIQDAYDQLEELEQKSIEVFGGIGEEGYRSAAQGFVDAWKSAFLETGDGLQGLQDHFDEFLQNWFVNQATMRIAGGMLEPLFRQIDSAVGAYGEGGTSAMLSEIERVRDMAAAIFPDLSLALEDLAGMFGVGEDGSLSGLAAGIQGMTEEQANILEAYWNSVRMYTASIDMNVSRIAQMLGVGGANTNPLLQQMSLIAANTQATHQLLQSVTKSGHSQGGYGIKVFND